MEAQALRAVLAGRYELGPAIGSGGFGTVYRARDHWSGAEVAVKLVRHGLGSEPAAQRLRREGAILRRVMSRHVARVYDVGDDETGVWLVTELVEGAPLTTTTLGRPLLPHEVLRVARGLLEGLAAVHAAGIVHGDVKPSNVLVPRGDKALDGAKLVDFGLARIVARSEVAASIGDAMMREGTVLGTARYMAPEVLTGGEPTTRSDLYAVGLVLFELLDEGVLFPVGDGRAQLRARVSNEPQLHDRVPEPLSDVLACMLAREPSRRYTDARAAHEAVADLDTAPVSVVRDDGLPSSGRMSVAPPAPLFSRSGGTPPPAAVPPSSRSTAPPAGPPSSRSIPPSSRSTAPPAGPPSSRSIPPPRQASPRALPALVTEASSRSTAPPAVAPVSHAFGPPLAGSISQALAPPLMPSAGLDPTARAPSVRPAAEERAPSSSRAPIARLTRLPHDGVVALRETLRCLDLPMLDALARRERGNPIGRIARAVALALRLELDAAALILEPLALQSDVARAIGAAVLAPCARRVTRARVDSDRDDRWVDSIDPELGAMLVALAAALSFSEDASRDVERCARALARLEPLPSSVQVDSTRTTLRIAQAAARVRRGELDRVVALDQVAPLAQADGRVEAPFHVVVRSLASAAFSDSPRAAADLERAERTAAETGTTLLDAASAAAFGAVLAMVSPRDERGLPVLERAGTLLAHGDAPSLEHEAEQHRAIVLIALGRWGDAVVHLRAAREAAHAERAGELEIMSAALETVAELALGNTQAAYEAAAILGDARLAGAKARTAALAWVARALASLSASDREGAEAALKQAEARARAADRKNVDVFVLVEILGILFESARGAAPSLEGSAAVLGRFAEERAIDSFHWLDLLNAIVGRIEDGDIRGKMGNALGRLVAAAGSLARERQADVPPEVAV